ncbi:MAG: hypothetical protein ACYSTF_08065 [Planctomycetota bacterium]
MSGRAEVCFAIVEGVVIYVVDEEVVGDVEDLAVHFDGDFLF